MIKFELIIKLSANRQGEFLRISLKLLLDNGYLKKSKLYVLQTWIMSMGRNSTTKHYIDNKFNLDWAIVLCRFLNGLDLKDLTIISSNISPSIPITPSINVTFIDIDGFDSEGELEELLIKSTTLPDINKRMCYISYLFNKSFIDTTDTTVLLMLFKQLSNTFLVNHLDIGHSIPSPIIGRMSYIHSRNEEYRTGVVVIFRGTRYLIPALVFKKRCEIRDKKLYFETSSQFINTITSEDLDKKFINDIMNTHSCKLFKKIILSRFGIILNLLDRISYVARLSPDRMVILIGLENSRLYNMKIQLLPIILRGVTFRIAELKNVKFKSCEILFTYNGKMKINDIDMQYCTVEIDDKLSIRNVKAFECSIKLNDTCKLYGANILETEIESEIVSGKKSLIKNSSLSNSLLNNVICNTIVWTVGVEYKNVLVIGTIISHPNQTPSRFIDTVIDATNNNGNFRQMIFTKCKFSDGTQIEDTPMDRRGVEYND